MRWAARLAVVGLAALGGACSGGDDDGAPSDAVCDLLAEPLAGGAFTGATSVAELVDRIAGDIREETTSVVVYLEPGASDDDLASVVDLIGGTVDAELDVVTVEEAFAEYEELFAEDQPELVESIDEGAMPASVRFRVDDEALVDEVTAAVEAGPTPVFRVVDSRGSSVAGVQALLLYAGGALDDLAEVTDDDEVAAAARQLEQAFEVDREATDDDLDEAILLLADGASSCGLLD